MPKTRAGFFSPTLEFYDAGHALGSAGIMVRGQKETLFFTAMSVFNDQTILKSARFEDVKADVLIMETTRGNRLCRPVSRVKAKSNVSVRPSTARSNAKASVLIPTFALGRTQEILALLAVLMREGKLQRQQSISAAWAAYSPRFTIWNRTARTGNIQPSVARSVESHRLEHGQAEKMKLTGGRLFVITAGHE